MANSYSYENVSNSYKNYKIDSKTLLYDKTPAEENGKPNVSQVLMAGGL